MTAGTPLTPTPNIKPIAAHKTQRLKNDRLFATAMGTAPYLSAAIIGWQVKSTSIAGRPGERMLEGAR